MRLSATTSTDRIDTLGENELIRRIRSWLGRACPPPPFGIGDDCAVLPASRGRGLVTVDPVIHGVHFDDGASPRDVGRKLLNRNASDIAAMGGAPTHAVVALALPGDVSIEWLRLFYAGLAATASRSGIAIVGGDVAGAPAFVASLTLLGRQAGRRVLARQGAKAGDSIWVTGKLGGSLLGRHLTFSPRLGEGRWLANHRSVRSMTDVSDGLAKDLRSLCPSGCLPALDPRRVPISTAARRLALHSGRPALAHALADGEDYELVFTLDRRYSADKFLREWKQSQSTPVRCIGRFVAEGALPEDHINPLAESGYEHLRRS